MWVYTFGAMDKINLLFVSCFRYASKFIYVLCCGTKPCHCVVFVVNIPIYGLKCSFSDKQKIIAYTNEKLIFQAFHYHSQGNGKKWVIVYA